MYLRSILLISSNSTFVYNHSLFSIFGACSHEILMNLIVSPPQVGFMCFVLDTSCVQVSAFYKNLSPSYLPALKTTSTIHQIIRQNTLVQQ